MARRRAEILEAAAGVFARRGYANATVAEIAEAADLAEGTLYNYFENKREILLAIARYTRGMMEDTIMAVEAMDDREAIIAMFGRAMELIEKRLLFIQALLGEAWVDDTILREFLTSHVEHIHALVADFIRRRIASGSFRPIDPDLAARFAIGMFASLVLPVLRGLEPMPDADECRRLAETMVDVLLIGLQVEPAVKDA
jgi:AcrR family transcriptional regulator